MGSCDNPEVTGNGRFVAAVLLGLSLGARASEPRTLGGGFGRPAPTPTRTPLPPPPPRPAVLPDAVRSPIVAAPTSRPSTVAAPPASAAPGRPAGASPIAAPARPVATPTKAPRVVGSPPRAAADVSVGYVLVPFVVTDRKGRPVAGLKRGDVTLLSDGVPVSIDLFEESTDAPVSYAVLLDGSGSMALAGKMEGARSAIEALVAMRVPGDDYALYVFAEGEVREIVPFTQDGGRIVLAARDVKPWGKTAFRDALAVMPEKSLAGRNGSRAIVLLSDGIDNDSEVGEEELSRIMEEVEVPVFPVGIRSPGGVPRLRSGATSEGGLNVDVLERVARGTGGRMAVVDDPKLLPRNILDIQKDLRSQYLIGFTPTGNGPVRYRRLTVRVAGSARPVRVRAGYRGTDPPALGTLRPGTK